MYLVAIAWMYVVLMMALAEAFSPQGSVLGAFFTFLLYGVLPLSIVMYLLATPQRRAARRRAAEREADTDADTDARSAQADDGSHTSTDAPVDALMTERKEP